MIRDYWRGCRPSKAAQVRGLLRSYAILPTLAAFMKATGIDMTPGEFSRCVRQIRAEQGKQPTKGRPVFRPLDVALDTEDLADHIAFSVAATAPKRAPNLEELEGGVTLDECLTLLEHLEEAS